MSDPFFDDEDVAVDHSRRRAVWGLSVLVMLAVIVVTVAVLFTGTHKGGPSNEGGGIDISTLSGAEPSSTASTRPRPSRSTTPSHPVSSSGPPSSPSSSPSSSSPSAGPGTAGLAAGINALRTSQHLQAVPATHSTAADECAAARGGGPTCVPHYMYAQVASQDPAVALAALEGVNKSWLLDAGTTRIEIGWSKLSSGGFNCAVLKFP